MNRTSGPSRVLVVEDSPTQAEQLRFVLEEGGYQVMVATSGEAALVILEDEKMDLVISDIMMPGIDGYELCRRIKVSSPDTPVVFLTTRRDPMDIFRGLECGADNFHTKPYDSANLLERISFILYNRALKQQGKLKVGLQVAFFGKIFTINSEKEQILDLLISAFEDTVTANRALEQHREELAEANRTIEEYARRLEGKIQSSEERYRAIVEGISEGIVTFTRDGTITSVNPAVGRIFGHEDVRLIGESIATLFTDVDPEELVARLVGSDGGIPWQARNARHASGEPLVVSILSNSVSLGSEDVFVAVFRDLTEEHRAAEQLRHAQKMETVGHLTGGIAHDFNNLLTVILGNSELLIEQLKDNPAALDLVEVTLSAAQRGSELTRRLLAFARKQPLKPQSVRCIELIDNLTGLLHRTLGKNITIDFRSGDDIWPAYVDSGQLEVALLNLAV